MALFSVTGGATYCAVASLRLMGFIEEDLLSRINSPCIIDVQMLLDWCLKVSSPIPNPLHEKTPLYFVFKIIYMSKVSQCRGRQAMVDIKEDQISLPIHVMHFGNFMASFKLL